MLAGLLDRDDKAADHLAEAMEIHERLRSPYWIARTQLEQAVLLRKRDSAGDAGRVDGLLDQVEAVAERFGFVALTRQSARLRP
jgi:hypothetical protein